MSKSQPAAYSPIHIVLHWVVAVLILFQLVFGESMGDLKHALRDGVTPDATVSVMGNAHIWVGIAILALTVIRLAVRAIYGVPAPLPGSAMQELAARAVHGLLYLAMVLAPVTGLLAWYGGLHTAEELHELSKPLFIVLVALHVVGAFYHQFALKDGGLRRMFSSRA